MVAKFPFRNISSHNEMLFQRNISSDSSINGFYRIDEMSIYLSNSKTVRDKDLRSHPQPEEETPPRKFPFIFI